MRGGLPVPAATTRSLPFRRDAWLPLAFPAGASRCWTDDDRVGRTLAAYGSVLDAADPEFAVYSGSLGRGPSAPRTVVTLSARPSDSGPWPVRRATRVGRGIALRVRAGRCARGLLRLGFDEPLWFPWEPDAQLRPPRADRPPSKLATVTAVNLELIAGDAHNTRISAFDAAVGAAAAAVGRDVEVERVLIRDRSLVGFDAKAVLRVELGPEEAGVLRQSEALERLRSLEPSPLLRGRIPQIEATGTDGLAVWSLERRFRGEALSGALVGDLEEQCLELLVELASLWGGEVSGEAIRDEATVVASSCDPNLASELERLRGWLTTRAERLPAVAAHGDFFQGNLIVADTGIEGLVDWERFVLGRPALHDLVHLRIAAAAAANGGYGRSACAWAEDPASRRDPLIRAYCERLGLTPGEPDLLAAAVSCWLAHTAHELRRVADNAEDPAWVCTNVDRPLATFARLTTARSA